jgi:hypothetical protein
MIAAPRSAGVQLCLDFLGKPRHRRVIRHTEAPPYWDSVDTADVGGELRARSRHVHLILDASQCAQATWIGSFDLVLGHDGASGVTKPQASRQDALTSAAYDMRRYCQRILDRATASSRDDVRAAREVLRWMTRLELL